ncbi:MAG: VWA domain-containing protein [Acidobacteria bacterium]|nr:VWA domain-containing protein [Acidobacteriota bacterium]
MLRRSFLALAPALGQAEMVVFLRRGSPPWALKLASEALVAGLLLVPSAAIMGFAFPLAATAYVSSDRPEQPVIVGFVLDVSNSARVYFKTYQDAIADLAYVLLPGDNKNKGFLVTYSTETDFLVKPTGDAEPIAEKIRKIKPGGGSSMLDAVYQSCNKYFSVKGQPLEPKRVLILVGDGHDNNSKVSLDQALEAAQRAQAVIYAVSTVAYGFTNPEESNLVRLTEETGGRVERPLQKIHEKVSGYLSTPSDEGNYAYTVGTGQYAAELSGKLYKAITDLTGNITQQYILGYTPPAPFTDRKFRTVKVAVNLKGADVKVRARKGYFPP